MAHRNRAGVPHPALSRNLMAPWSCDLFLMWALLICIWTARTSGLEWLGNSCIDMGGGGEGLHEGVILQYF